MYGCVQVCTARSDNKHSSLALVQRLVGKVVLTTARSIRIGELIRVPENVRADEEVRRGNAI